MRKPAPTETMQIGIVVRELDATIRGYEEDFGIGPWHVHQSRPVEAKEWRELGQPTQPSTRLATAMVSGVQWELIQPLEDKSIYANDQLAELREGAGG